MYKMIQSLKQGLVSKPELVLKDQLVLVGLKRIPVVKGPSTLGPESVKQAEIPQTDPSLQAQAAARYLSAPCLVQTSWTSRNSLFT